MSEMRGLALVVALALVIAACSSASDSDTGTPDAANTAQEASGQAATGGKFCSTVQAMIDDLDALDTDDPDLDPVAMYAMVSRVYKQLGAAAPSELQGDFDVLVAGTEKLEAWAKDPSGTSPLDETDNQGFEEANDRVNAFIEEECGIDIDDGSDTAFESDDSDTAAGNTGSNEATQTISVGGETYAEDLNGVMEVSCDMYGDLDSGSINIYLDGPDFQTSVSSFDSGIEAGNYGGLIWVFASDPRVDEQVWDLQEIDGTFVLDRAEKVSDEEWLFTGTFSAVSATDPATSIDASFTCVGLVGI